MKTYKVTLYGSLDETSVDIELTNHELDVLIKVGLELNRESKTECMPTIEVYDYEKETKILKTN